MYEKDSKSLAEFYFNMQKLIHKNNPNVQLYRKTRKVFDEIVQKMGAELNASTRPFDFYLPPLDLQGRTLEFDLDQHLDNHVYFDLLIYEHDNKNRKLASEYLNKKRVRSKQKIEILQAMVDSTIGLYRILDVDKVNCIVSVKDVISGKKRSFTDEKLSYSYSPEHKNEMYYMIRIIETNEVSFQTGIMIQFVANDPTLKNFIKFAKKYRHSQTKLLWQLFAFHKLRLLKSFESYN